MADRGQSVLDGIRVADLSMAASGPFCTQILGDLGADVVKIEPPAGDSIRGWDDLASSGTGSYFSGLNRNKRSVVLDLKTPYGIALAQRLCAQADVVIENWRPGKAQRIGLGYDAVKALNSEVVYVSLSAFGESGPLTGAPGMDIVLQAFAGIMGITGESGGPPIKVGAPIADLATAYVAALSILAALLHRERTGEGQRVTLSMLGVVTSLLSNHATGHLLHGNEISRMGSAHPQIVPYQAFPTGSDEYLVIGVMSEAHWLRFVAAIDRAELAEDARFRTNRERVANRQALVQIIIDRLMMHPRSVWIDRFGQHDVPVTVVNSLGDLFAHPQAEAEGLVVWLDGEGSDRLPVLASPMRFEKTPVRYRRRPPSLGQHTDEIVAELDAVLAAGALTTRPTSGARSGRRSSR